MPSSVTLKGETVQLSGSEVKVGQQAPDVTVAKNLKETAKISDYKGNTLILCSVPSLDTPVCDLEGKRFNEEAEKLGDDVKVLMVSMDLPPAQARWCGANDVKNVSCVSDYKGREFGEKYGTFMPALGILCRAVFVIGPDGKVKHAEYVPEIAEQPNFDAALQAARS